MANNSKQKHKQATKVYQLMRNLESLMLPLNSWHAEHFEFSKVLGTDNKYFTHPHAISFEQRPALPFPFPLLSSLQHPVREAEVLHC